MGEHRPGIPEIIEVLAAEMERKDIAQKMTADFRKLWSTLLPNSRILPCPFCYAEGYIGNLSMLPPDIYGSEAVCCDTCGVNITTRRVN